MLCIVVKSTVSGTLKACALGQEAGRPRGVMVDVRVGLAGGRSDSAKTFFVFLFRTLQGQRRDLLGLQRTLRSARTPSARGA